MHFGARKGSQNPGFLEILAGWQAGWLAESGFPSGFLKDLHSGTRKGSQIPGSPGNPGWEMLGNQ